MKLIKTTLRLTTLASILPCASCFFLWFPIFPNLECILRFLLFGFDIEAFERYDRFFRDDSSMTLAKGGSYIGADAIEEYVKFVSNPDSDYFALPQNVIVDQTLLFQGYEPEKGQCQFLAIYNSQYKTNPNTTFGEIDMHVTSMIKLYFDFAHWYIPRVDVFYTKAFISWLFDDILNSDPTRAYVCDAMRDSCQGEIETPENCEAELAQLPVSEGRADSNTQACRALVSIWIQSLLSNRFSPRWIISVHTQNSMPT